MKFSRTLIKSIIFSAGAVFIAVCIFIYNATDISHQAISCRLRFLCEGIYQYRTATGSWPAKAADLALRELFGSSADPQAYRQGIQGVTPERVQAFARRYFLLNRYTLAVLGP